MKRIAQWNRWQWGMLIAAVGLSGWGLSQAVEAFSRPDAEMIATGQELFVHVWTANDPLSAEGDGLGPVFNAKSCVACHFQGGVGGAGPNDRNVTAFKALPQPGAKSPEVAAGVIHADAISDIFRETPTTLRDRFPIIRGAVREMDGCSYREPDFDPLIVDSVNTPPIFGLGLIDAISDGEIKSRNRWNMLSNIGHELQGDFDNIPAGRPRILPDGRVGKFGWKGQFATVEEFVATACAVEVGLTNPLRAQDVPHESRPDDAAGLDLDKRQFRSLVAFCETLARPEQLMPTAADERALVARGQELFSAVGCAVCHVPDIGDVAGVYSDFLLHEINTVDIPGGGYEPIPAEIPLPHSEPRPNEWKTPPLWGVADSAPYMHDGSAPTLRDAIQQHGGDARTVREAFFKLKADEQAAVIAFLKTLRAPQPAGQIVADSGQ